MVNIVDRRDRSHVWISNENQVENVECERTAMCRIEYSEWKRHKKGERHQENRRVRARARWPTIQISYFSLKHNEIMVLCIFIG